MIKIRILNIYDYILIIGVTFTSILYSFLTKEVDIIGIIAGVTGLVNVVLVAKGNIYNYFFGIVNVSLYAFISYKSELFGDAALNFLYYLPMQFIGWYKWTKKKILSNPNQVKGNLMNLKQRGLLGIISTISIIIVGLILKQVGDPQPFKDAATTTLSIIAMLLMVKAYAEQWVLWIIVNIISVIMWITIGTNGGDHAELMIIMWIFYLANSINGLRIWFTQISK